MVYIRQGSPCPARSHTLSSIRVRYFNHMAANVRIKLNQLFGACGIYTLYTQGFISRRIINILKTEVIFSVEMKKRKKEKKNGNVSNITRYETVYKGA